MKPNQLFTAIVLIFTLSIYSCTLFCPCKKKPLQAQAVEVSYQKWRNMYIMKDLSASEYIDLLEGEIDRMNREKTKKLK